MTAFGEGRPAENAKVTTYGVDPLPGVDPLTAVASRMRRELVLDNDSFEVAGGWVGMGWDRQCREGMVPSWRNVVDTKIGSATHLAVELTDVATTLQDPGVVASYGARAGWTACKTTRVLRGVPYADERYVHATPEVGKECWADACLRRANND
jgi:hypothetical protein